MKTPLLGKLDVADALEVVDNLCGSCEATLMVDIPCWGDGTVAVVSVVGRPLPIVVEEIGGIFALSFDF